MRFFTIFHRSLLAKGSGAASRSCCRMRPSAAAQAACAEATVPALRPAAPMQASPATRFAAARARSAAAASFNIRHDASNSNGPHEQQCSTRAAHPQVNVLMLYSIRGRREVSHAVPQPQRWRVAALQMTLAACRPFAAAAAVELTWMKPERPHPPQQCAHQDVSLQACGEDGWTV